MVIDVMMNQNPSNPTPLSAKTLSPEFLGTIQSHTDLAIETLRDTDPTQDLTGLDLTFAKALSSKFTAAEQTRRAEYNIVLAQHGFPPLDSIDGLIKLHQLLSDSFRQSHLLPAQVKQKLVRIERDLELLALTRHDFLIKGQEDARREALRATQELERTRTELEAERIKRQQVLDNAATEVRVSSVANTRKQGITENEKQVLPRELNNDLLKKRISSTKEFSRLIWDVLRRPVRWMLVITIVAMIYSLIAEAGGSEMYPIIAPFNELRHLIFDPVWAAVESFTSS